VPTLRQPRYSKAEFASRGGAIYDRDVRLQLAASDEGKFVAIDIETGAWEMDADALPACDRLIARLPGSQTWLERVGYRYVHRLGGPRRRPTL
jgi:hypothetical protein